MAVPHNVARQLRPDSPIVQELREPAPGCRTRIVAFWSDLDQMIVPKRSARIVHEDLNARNVFVRGVGHMSLPVDGRVVHQIGTTLAHLDADGTTLAAGATAIQSEPGRPSASRARSAGTGSARKKGASARAASS